MEQVRLYSRHKHRLLPGVIATFVAAMAFANGGGHQNRPGAASGEAAVPASGDGGAGAAAAETWQSRSSDPGATGGPYGAPDDPAAGQGPAGVSRGDGPSGFMPNGENGLLRLADFAAQQTGGAAADNENQGGEVDEGGPAGESPLDAADPAAGGPGDAGDKPLADPGLGDTPPGDGGGFFGSPGGDGGGFGGGGGGPVGGGGRPNLTPGPTPTDGPLPPLPIVNPDQPPTGCDLSGCVKPPGGGGTIPPAIFTPNATPVIPGLDTPDAVALPSPVPEPASWLLLIAGFGGLGAALRGRRPALRAIAH